MVFFYGIAYKFHSLCIFGVGDVIGEHSIRFKELTACNFRTESFKNICGIETAYTVAGIDYYFKAFKRVMIVVFGVDFFFNEFTEISGIAAHIIGFNKFTVFTAFRLFTVLCILENGCNIVTFKTAAAGEEFQTVSVIGVMACSYLDSTVTAQLNSCHEHGRSRGKVTVDNIYACIKESFFDDSRNGRT